MLQSTTPSSKNSWRKARWRIFRRKPYVRRWVWPITERIQDDRMLTWLNIIRISTRSRKGLRRSLSMSWHRRRTKIKCRANRARKHFRTMCVIRLKDRNHGSLKNRQSLMRKLRKMKTKLSRSRLWPWSSRICKKRGKKNWKKKNQDLWASTFINSDQRICLRLVSRIWIHFCIMNKWPKLNIRISKAPMSRLKSRAYRQVKSLKSSKNTKSSWKVHQMQIWLTESALCLKSPKPRRAKISKAYFKKVMTKLTKTWIAQGSSQNQRDMENKGSLSERREVSIQIWISENHRLYRQNEMPGWRRWRRFLKVWVSISENFRAGILLNGRSRWELDKAWSVTEVSPTYSRLQSKHQWPPCLATFEASIPSLRLNFDKACKTSLPLKMDRQHRVFASQTCWASILAETINLQQPTPQVEAAPETPTSKCRSSHMACSHNNNKEKNWPEQEWASWMLVLPSNLCSTVVPSRSHHQISAYNWRNLKA